MVTIEPDWDDGPDRYGDTQIEWDASRFSAIEYCHHLATVALAGPAAEMVFRGEPLHPGLVAEWSADWKAAWRAVDSLIPDERKRLEFLEQLAVELFRLFGRDDVWSAVSAVVDELLAHESLDGEQVESVLADWPS